MQFIAGFKNLGPLAPIFLAFIESVIPALPLVVIVTFNGTAHGALLGFLYSWVGSAIGSIVMFFFYRKLIKRWLMHWMLQRQGVHKALKWIENQGGGILFILSCLPFTPSSFINLVYGLSDYEPKSFIITMILAKFLMVGSLALFGNTLVLSFSQPIYILLALILIGILMLLSRYISNKTGIASAQNKHK